MQVCIENAIDMLENMHLKMLIYAFIFNKNHKICVYNTNMLKFVYLYLLLFI